MVADSEALKVFATILKELNISFKIKLNDRRLLDLAILTKAKCDKSMFNSVCSSIDKLDKEPWQAVEEELKEKQLTADMIAEIKQFVHLECQDPANVVPQLKAYFGEHSAIDDVASLFENLKAMGINEHFQFDTSLARGLDYYTGMIFEGVLTGEDAQYGIGSIAGGGRYDNLIGMFSND